MLFARQNAVVPVGSDDATTTNSFCLGNLATRVSDRVWGYAHAEYLGFYSLEKLHAFQPSTESSFAYQLESALLAMVPTAIAIGSLDLFPLQDPTLPWTQNPGFYVRQLIRAWLCALGNNNRIQEFIPQLRQPWSRLLPLALVQVLPYVATQMCVAQAFHIFPVPLCHITPLLPALLIVMATHYLFLRRISIEAESAIKTAVGECGASSPWQAAWTEQMLSFKTKYHSQWANHRDRNSQPPLVQLRSAYFRFEQATLAILPVGAAKVVFKIQNERATRAVASVFHCRELVLLRLFVDITVPLSYLVYCSVVQCIPTATGSTSRTLPV